MYVDDVTSTGACTTDTTECFIQSLSLNSNNKATIYFSENNATEDGSNIYGGLLNRCIPSQILLLNGVSYEHGVSYVNDISNIKPKAIASLPVQVCFCNHYGQPDCSYQLPSIYVKKGERFTVSLVAVDQVEHPVEANITSFLSSFQGAFIEGQRTQKVTKNCTSLTFNVLSPESYETLGLYAEGPCANSDPSVRYLNITFKT